MLFKRKGIWQARVKNEFGQWISKTTNTADRKVAEIRHREIERKHADPAYRLATETTFKSAVDAFVTSRTRKGCAAGTLHMYDVKTRQLREAIGDETPLSRLDARMVDKYIDGRLAIKISRSTIGKELCALRGILKIARRAGTFTREVSEVMPSEWSNEYTPVERALSKDEVTALVVAMAATRIKPQGGGKERNALNQAACVAFMVAAGVRLGEALRAEKGDINLKTGMIFVRCTKTKRKGRGDRYVPLTALSFSLAEEVARATTGRTGRLFDKWGNVQRDIADACVLASIPRCSPNDLRRTHGVWLRAAGAEPHLIGGALGHADSRMAERVYGRLTPEGLKKLLVAAAGPAN